MSIPGGPGVHGWTRTRGAISALVMWVTILGCGNPLAVAQRRDEPQKDQSPSHPFPGDASPELWVLAGQSNMQGYGARKEPFQSDPRIQVFGLDNRWMVSEPPIHRLPIAVAEYHRRYYAQLIELGRLTTQQLEMLQSDSRKGLVGGVGPGEYFAQHVVRHLDRPVGLIPCAFGGTSMSQWDPKLRDRGNASLYGAMLERIRMVGGKIRGILWYQGEAETYSPATVSAYRQNLLDFIDSVRKDTGIPELPFIYVQLGRYTMPNPDLAGAWEHVREVQRQVAAQRSNAWMVSAIDLPLDDIIHIASEGQQRLGRRLAEVALTGVYRVPGHAESITLASVEILGPADRPRIRVRYSGVHGRLSAQGRPNGFVLRSNSAPELAPTVFRTDFDPDDPASLILRVYNPIREAVQLVYAPGLDPFANIVDEEDMPVPAFGPLPIPYLPAQGDSERAPHSPGSR